MASYGKITASDVGDTHDMPFAPPKYASGISSNDATAAGATSPSLVGFRTSSDDMLPERTLMRSASLQLPSPEEVREKLRHWSDWATRRYMCSKQLVSEQLGQRRSSSSDSDLEARIEQLEELQRRYALVLRLAERLASHEQHVVTTQKALGDAMAQLAVLPMRDDALASGFQGNAELQLVVAKNGEDLVLG